MPALAWEGAPQLRGLSPEEVLEKAQQGHIILERDGMVPENSLASLAIARVLRESGAFGLSASKLVDASKEDMFSDLEANSTDE